MPKRTDGTVEFGRVGRRVVEAAFDGGDIVSDGGVLLLQRVNERLGPTHAAALTLGDERRITRVQHNLLAQRIYGQRPPLQLRASLPSAVVRPAGHQRHGLGRRPPPRSCAADPHRHARRTPVRARPTLRLRAGRSRAGLDLDGDGARRRVLMRPFAESAFARGVGMNASSSSRA